MSLTDKQKRHLKKLGHSLKPVVTVGQAGLTAGVLGELEIALDHHELLKVKVNAGGREERDRIIDEIVRHSGAEPVQRIGNIAVLYRPNPKKKAPLELPKG
jgi:RNA-binding protein